MFSRIKSIEFPYYLKYIKDDTTVNLSPNIYNLRKQIIEVIFEMSKLYSIKDIKNKIKIDLDENNNIVGLDLSILMNIPNLEYCIGNIGLKTINFNEIKEIHLLNMKYKN